MSNALSVAGVTAALVHRLTAALSPYAAELGSASPGRPDTTGGADDQLGIKVFLYRVEPNAALRNSDLPTRSGDALIDRPKAALSLQYLLVFLGDETSYKPDRMLGVAATSLHAQPVLGRDEITAGWNEAGLGAFLMDLADASERVRITALTLSIDELSNLWSSFFGAPYRLSMAVQADVVVLSPDTAPVRALPVTTRTVISSTILNPRITSIVAAPSPSGAPQPIVAGATIHISGTALLGNEDTAIWIGDQVVAPAAITGERATLVVPAAVRPGAIGVAVEHRRMLGDPPSLRPMGRSPLFPIVVAPEITGAIVATNVTPAAGTAPRSGTITLTLTAPIDERQPVTLLLNAGGSAFSFDAAPRPAATATIDFGFAGVPKGEYLVRIVVAGAQSRLTQVAAGAAAGTFDGPKVSIP